MKPDDPGIYLSPVDPEHVRFLTELQLTLESHYDIDLPYSICDFVCHSAQTETGLASCKGTTPEMLVYREDETNFDLSLFLNPALLSGIDNDTYKRDWQGQIFDNGCIVLEGVSHFLHMVFNAHYDRQVSLLDLEIQAEIDKFIFAVLNTGYRDSPPDLLSRLFCNISYRDELSDELKLRYQTANDLAYSYSQWLTENFVLSRHDKSLLAEIGKIYRLNGLAKQQYIRQVTTPLRLAS